MIQVHQDYRYNAQRNRFVEEPIFGEEIITEIRTLHDNLDGESMCDELEKFKSSILLPIEENPIQVIPPSLVRLNHEMNLWTITKRINAMGENVNIEEL